MNRSEQQREEERLIFEPFLNLQPDFAEEPITNWRSASSDPPDILCTTNSGRVVGVELGEWLHLEEMKAGKLRERIDGLILEAIGEPQPVNRSEHFDMVRLHPKHRVRIPGEQQNVFRNAILKLIDEVDRRWPDERFWQSPQGCHIRDLSSYSPLDRHLLEVHFHPGQTRWPEGTKWIVQAVDVDWFDDRTIVEPLLRLLRKKLMKYRKHQIEGCDELVLLVFFNQALMFNSPLQTPRRRIEVIVEEVRSKVHDDTAPFQRAFLFLAPTPGARVFRLW